MKKEYLKPLLSSLIILHEEGVATTSYSTVSFGDSNNPYNPNITDWESSTIGTESFEL